MKHLSSLLLMTAMIVVSCQVVEVPDLSSNFTKEKREIVITASLDDSPITKTEHIDYKKVYWSPNDEIVIFSAEEASKFTSLNEERAKAAKFKGQISVVSGLNDDMEDSYIWGLYPYDPDATLKNGLITTTLPSEQLGAKNTFADDLLITMGRSLNFSIPFYHVCSGLRFTLTTEGVKTVTLSANGGEAIAGKFSVGVDDDGKPVIDSVIDPSSSITVSAPDNGTFETGVWYYIITLPVTFSEGVTFTMKTEDMIGIKPISSSFSLKQGYISTATNMDEGIEYNPGFDPYSTPLCFEAITDGTISFTPTLQTANDSYLYSHDLVSWLTLSPQVNGNSISITAGERVYIKSQNSKSKLQERIVLRSGSFYIFGNLMSLLSPDFESLTELGYEAFKEVFYNNTNLFNHPYNRLVLSNTSSGKSCCFRMFYGCTGLTSAPELPATTLAESCYSEMFYGCTGLTSVPELPATTLALACYSNMFYGCTGITSAPQILPATTLASSCYYGMFDGCTGLTSAPELPAMTLANNCYSYMFYGCTGLTSAPQILPATTLASSCYENMFYGCTGLTSAPQILPATTLARSCYENMFYGCTGLTSAPQLPATTLAQECYSSMFRGCTGLTSAPELPAMTLANNCYSDMFYGCTGLTSAPQILPATTLAESCYSGMFGWTGLTSAPELPATTLAESCYSLMFRGCTGLTSAPQLPAMTLANNCYSYMFYGCTGLTSAPQLPAMTLANNCYSYMFYGCTGLTSAPELLATTLAQSCYYGMFAYCTGITTGPALPATTLKASCYYGMFAGCTGLTSAPELPATTLVENCYSFMFNGCSNLSYVKCYAVSMSSSSTTDWMKSVSNNGTFVKNSECEWERGVSGIPSLWSVISETIIIEDILLNKNAVSIHPGELFSLTATLLPEYATDKTITWSSSDATVATVSTTGVVTGVNEGNATISAQCGDVIATCSVDVFEAIREDFNPNTYLLYRANETGGWNGDDYKTTVSYMPGISGAKVEMKFQLTGPGPISSDNIAHDEYDFMDITETELVWNVIYEDGGDWYNDIRSFSIPGASSLLLIDFDGVGHTMTVNGIVSACGRSEMSLPRLFASFGHESDEGVWEVYSGVPDGSKLYFVKAWDSDDTLNYIGYATTAVNPATNNTEYCWCNYYPKTGEVSYTFANDAIHQGGFEGYTYE